MNNEYFVIGNEVMIKLQNDFNLWTIISLSDLDLVSSFDGNWISEETNVGYYVIMDRRINDRREIIRMHRIILHLLPSDALEPDHKNRNTLDNRHDNLRAVTRSINNFNKNLLKNNKSGVTGVFYNKRIDRWWAYIEIDGKRRNLGHFHKKQQAIEARLKAEDAYVL